jgi:LysM repeat protein
VRKLLVVVLSPLLLAAYPAESGADATYTIKKGDTIYGLAKTFKVGVPDLTAANKIDPEHLKPGTKIRIPSKGTAGKDRVAKSAGNRRKASSCSQKPSVSGVKEGSGAATEPFHVVKKGDTLSSLARKYSLTVEDLKELNDLNAAKGLKAGQKLLLRKTGPRTYTVKKGDTIWKIAKKFAMDEEEIMFLNDLETDDLRPGRKLLLEEWIDPSEMKSREVLVAEDKKIDEEITPLPNTPALEAASMKERLILFARKMLNIPYRFGGSGVMGIDCSGYVQKVFSFLNVPLPRTAREQYALGEPVEKEDLTIGDLVFFRTYASFPSHVGIYLGNDLFIHASSKGRKVTIDSLDTPYYIRRFIGAKRLLTDEASDLRGTNEKG